MNKLSQIRTLLFLIGIFVFPKIATGCALVPRPTVLEAYNSADVVIIAKAISQEKGSAQSPVSFIGTRVLSTTMEVEKVFKGNLRVGDKVTLGQGNGLDCTRVFYEDDITKEYLLYLEAPPRGSQLWFDFGFTRTHRLEFVADDLLYLNNIDRRRGQTRVSGTLDDDGGQEIAGKKIWLMRGSKVYETTTDENGVYEFYGVPAGRYVLQPELSAGWKISRETIGTTTISDREKQIRTRQVIFNLKPRQHAAIDLAFVLDNVVSGTLVDLRGRPFVDVQVFLKSTDPANESMSFESTDTAGHFAIESIEPGNYVLVVNEDGEKRIEEPFPAIYYPSVTDQAKARVFRIRPGDSIKGLKLIVPEVEEMVTVAGVVRYADGRPGPKSTVRFTPEERKNVDGSAIQDTQEGRFSFKIFKGLPGEVHADFFAYTGRTAEILRRYDFSKCPEVQKLIKQSGKDSMMIKTPAIKLNPQQDIRNVVLIYPFRGCNRQ